jgi:hypothetical protein
MTDAAPGLFAAWAASWRRFRTSLRGGDQTSGGPVSDLTGFGGGPGADAACADRGGDLDACAGSDAGGGDGGSDAGGGDGGGD